MPHRPLCLQPYRQMKKGWMGNWLERLQKNHMHNRYFCNLPQKGHNSKPAGISTSWSSLVYSSFFLSADLILLQKSGTKITPRTPRGIAANSNTGRSVQAKVAFAKTMKNMKKLKTAIIKKRTIRENAIIALHLAFLIFSSRASILSCSDKAIPKPVSVEQLRNTSAGMAILAICIDW